MVPGICVGDARPWFFDGLLRRCRQNHGGGCNRNENSFRTLQQCEATCVAPGTAVCRVPIASGEKCARGGTDPGVFFGFDASTGGCVGFLYAGCGGNANRFDTKSGCTIFCSYGAGVAGGGDAVAASASIQTASAQRR